MPWHFGIFFVNGNILFFSSNNYICSMISSGTTKLLYTYKLCLFSILSNAYIVDIEYTQGICSSIFIVEDFSGLLVHPSIYSIKDSRSA